MPIVKILLNLNHFFLKIGNKLQSPFILILRLYFGYSFISTGIGKLTHLAPTASFFESINIPFPMANAIFVGGLETVGGLLLLLGLFSRLISVPLIGTMVTAIATAHREELVQIFTTPKLVLKLDPILYLLTCLIVLSFGAGAYSIDAFMARKFCPDKS